MTSQEAMDLLGITNKEWQSFKKKQANDHRLIAHSILLEEMAKTKGRELNVLSVVGSTLNRLDDVSQVASDLFYGDFFTLYERERSDA
jgi:hypothetical protein